jgi:N-acetylneuraminic acid mutarotase
MEEIMGIFMRKKWQSIFIAFALAITSATSLLTDSVSAVAGDIGPWQTATNTLPAERVVGASVEYNGFIYIIGGRNASINETVSTVYYSHIANSGQPDTWSSTSNLPQALDFASGFTANGYIYAVGGIYDSSGTASTVIYYTQPNSDGTLSEWRSATELAPHTLASAVVVNDYLYIIGGIVPSLDPNGESDLYPPVYYAQLNNDGSIGPWQISSIRLPVQSFIPSIVTHNDYIYILGGGDNTSGQASSSTVHYAHVNSDGSIDPWTVSNIPLPQPTGFGTSIVANGYIYIMGGSPTVQANIATDVVLYSRISSDGSLEEWQTSIHQLPVPRTGAMSVLVNDRIYIIGGWNSDYDASLSNKIYITSVEPQTITPPTNLTALTPTKQKPALSWDSVPEATSYTVHRNGSLVGTSSTASFTDMALSADGNYSYTVTASNGSISSESSLPFTVQYDSTSPTATGATISGWLAIHWANPSISANASDALSGAVGGEFYVDTDPGQGNGTPMTYSDGKIRGKVLISGGGGGWHTVYMRSKDAAGNWSTTTSVRYFYIG